jgi:UTP--glucose-1-phosphate uridylyltransferase
MDYMNTLNLFIEKMNQHKLPELVIQTFSTYYQQLISGENGLIPEESLIPVKKNEIADCVDLQKNEHYQENDYLKEVVFIKLNGGLGTTMGLSGPKSLLPVKNDLTFLDIIAQQITYLNKVHGIKIPLLLMNSFRTEKESLQVLEKYADLISDIPLSFQQHKFPKVLLDSLLPASYPEDPSLEWNPPGHGDIFSAFKTSGILNRLIQRGYKYAFISNIDNLGATLDTGILEYFAKNEFSFLVEVTDRTWMDRKGGHLARLKQNGRLCLREAAQCADVDNESFQNIDRHVFFNTNNIWINLESLEQTIQKSKNMIVLPIIRNRKKLNPVDKSTPDVYQIESAMGTAISVFDNATALRVPRSRFAPVKNTNDLLLLWSDLYEMTEMYQIKPNKSTPNSTANIALDPAYYSFIDQLYERFPFGAPSLKQCTGLSITGDFKFGNNVQINGNVNLKNTGEKQYFISDNMNIDHDIVI